MLDEWMRGVIDRYIFVMFRSLCPTICGHEVRHYLLLCIFVTLMCQFQLVKAGLLLGLFGGCQDFSDNQNKV